MMYNIFFTRSFHNLRIGVGGVGIYMKNLVSNLNYELFNVINFKEINNDKLLTLVDSVKGITIRNIALKARVLISFLTFPFKIYFCDAHIIHANPSFNFIALIREGLFILISSLFNRRIVVFIHGWDPKVEKKVMTDKLLLHLFQKVYNKSDVIIVLSHDFKEKLCQMGIKKKILVETTMVDDELINGLNIQAKSKTTNNEHTIRILFLSRVVRTKGIYEAIESFSILSKKYDNVELLVAGDGPELQAVKGYVTSHHLSNIKFLGYVGEKAKKKVFLNSHIYFFPSYHEGMPISVLEAMAFGLPVVTRAVGGLKDFFKNGEHGFITNSRDPKYFAYLLERLIANESLRTKISVFNYNYAQKKFLASEVTKRIESIYLNLMETDKL